MELSFQFLKHKEIFLPTLRFKMVIWSILSMRHEVSTTNHLTPSPTCHTTVVVLGQSSDYLELGSEPDYQVIFLEQLVPGGNVQNNSEN